MKKILKPKSKFDVLNNFRDRIKEKYNVHIDIYKFEDFINEYNKVFTNKVKVWIICSLMWILGLSIIINSIVAAANNYFWVPITGIKSMFNFINVFWIILWFAFPIFIIIYGIIIISKMNNQ